MQQLTEVEQDYSYSLGFVEQWLATAKPPTPIQVMEHLKMLSAGIQGYREKYVSLQEAYTDLQGKYNALTAMSAQHLQFMSQQKEMLDQALADSQREFHPQERNLIET